MPIARALADAGSLTPFVMAVKTVFKGVASDRNGALLTILCIIAICKGWLATFFSTVAEGFKELE